MANSFKIHSRNDSITEGWQNSEQLDLDAINGILDTQGGGGHIDVSSIATPYARFLLVEEAFKHLTALAEPNAQDLQEGSSFHLENIGELLGKLRGDSAYHRLVSQVLDVAELLFNKPLFGDNLTFLLWKKDIELESLKTSTYNQHKQLGSVLEKYEKDFNLDNLYFIKYDNQLVGSTSPLTLFIGHPDHPVLNLSIGQPYKLFSDKPVSLLERDPEFIKYLFVLFKNKGDDNFRTELVAFDKYLNVTKTFFKFFDEDFYKEIDKASTPRNFNKKYKSIAVKKKSSQTVTVFGTNLLQKESFNIESDFKIYTPPKKADQEPNEAKQEPNEAKLKPLVLKSQSSIDLLYVNHQKWDDSIRIPPTIDAKGNIISINERVLPEFGDFKYPWITASDLLEDTILRLPYTMDTDAFFDGNIEDNNVTKSYFLLPLKKRFFDYFTIKELKNGINGQHLITMKTESSGAVTVTLHIPIKDGAVFINFERTYLEPASMHDIDRHYQVKWNGSVSITPFIKITTEGFDNNYFVQHVHKQVSTNDKSTVICYLENDIENDIEIKDFETRTKGGKGVIQTEYVPIKGNISYLQVNYKLINGDETHGIIIPKFKEVQNGSKPAAFAIDFGTTTTHIECKIEGEKYKTFDFSGEPYFIRSLIEYQSSPETKNRLQFVKDVRKHTIQEMFPDSIGESGFTSFPIFTVLSEGSNPQGHTSSLYTHHNINFSYGIFDSNETIRANLKWDFDPDNVIRIKNYFKHLALLVKTYLLLPEKGKGKDKEKDKEKDVDLNQVTFKWLYPTSMPNHMWKRINSAWENVINNGEERLFTEQTKIFKYSESIAPYFYYKDNKAYPKGRAINIDIGGETTDIVFISNKVPQYLASVRFAANALFGDGYNTGQADVTNPSTSNNGFVLKYYDEYIKLFKSNYDSYNFDAHFKSIYNNTSSAGAISFLFSLKKTMTNYNRYTNTFNNPAKFAIFLRQIDFIEKLKDNNDFKILFLIHFSAIIYYLAKLLNNISPEGESIVPPYVSFSGNGSVIAEILDGTGAGKKENPEYPNLQKLFNYIFQKVSPISSTDAIKFYKDANPKNVSCKGCLMDTQNTPLDELDKIFLINNKVFSSNVTDKNTPKPPNYDEYIKSITGRNGLIGIGDFLENTKKEYKSFINFVFDMNGNDTDHINFFDLFGIDPNKIAEYKSFLTEDVIISSKLLDGFKIKNHELGGNLNQQVEETPFFYILKGILPDLAKQIVEDNENEG